MGKNRVIIREWDGIDKPQYYPVMDIAEEELDFKGGRFEKCIGMAKSGIPGQDLYLHVSQPVKEFGPIIDWVAENIENKWAVDIESTMFEEVWRFSFTNLEDAVLFKLTWNAKSTVSDLLGEEFW